MGDHLCVLLLCRFFCGEKDGRVIMRVSHLKRWWGEILRLKRSKYSTQVSPDTVNVLMGLTPVSVDKVIVHSGYSQSGVLLFDFMSVTLYKWKIRWLLISGDENNIALWRLAQASKESPLCLPAQVFTHTSSCHIPFMQQNSHLKSTYIGESASFYMGI